MGAPSEGRVDAPVSRAVLVAVIALAAVLGLFVLVVGLMSRGASSTDWTDVSLPTYPTDAWTGEATPVADGLALELTVPNTACPSATGPSGASVAVILADSWTARWPVTTGLQTGAAPVLEGGPDDVMLDLADGLAVTGRPLDLSLADDAALARSWIDACGEADAVVVAAPDGLAPGAAS